MYLHWRSIVTKHFIAHRQGSTAAADTLQEQVPLVMDMTLRWGKNDPPKQNLGWSKLRSLGVFKAWDQKQI